MTTHPRARRVELGRVVGAHALRGEVRVRIFGDGPAHLMSLPGAWLASSIDDRDARYFEIDGAGTGRTREVRLALRGIEDRGAAEALRGLLLLGLDTDLEPLADGDYYWHELIGCAVETEAGESVGRVKEIWETGAHDVLVVERENGERVLIPTAREIMTRVDIGAERIVIDAIPGLLEA